MPRNDEEKRIVSKPVSGPKSQKKTTQQRLAKYSPEKVVRCPIKNWNVANDIGDVFPVKGIKAIIRSSSLGLKRTDQNLENRYVTFRIKDLGVVEYGDRARCGVLSATLEPLGSKI